MKALVVLLTTCTLAAGAAETFHEFTANDGRTLKAQVISYDSSTGKVKIKRDDGTPLRVKVGAFSAKDQAYIREWEAISVFMSERSVPLTLSRVEDRKWKQTRETTQRGQSGNKGSMPGGPQGPGGGGGMGGDEGGDSGGGQQGGGSEVVATDKYARYHYQIKLSNRTPVPLKNLSVNYRIFYEQDRAVPEESAHAPQQSRSGPEMNGQEQGFYHAEPQSLEATGKISVDVLAPHSRKMVPTVGVSILNRNARSGAGGEMIDLEGEIKGIWVKVSMKAPDGSMRTREVALPKRIITTHTWSSAGTSMEKRG